MDQPTASKPRRRKHEKQFDDAELALMQNQNYREHTRSQLDILQEIRTAMSACIQAPPIDGEYAGVLPMFNTIDREGLRDRYFAVLNGLCPYIPA